MISETALKQTLNGLDNYLVEMMNKNTLAGLAVGVVHEGELVYCKGMGYADIAQATPVTMDTGFRIASISKTFTAIGILQLLEQGKFNLDDSVNRYLKGFKVMHKDAFSPPVTFRHLLTHTSGIGEAPTIREALPILLGKDPYFAKEGERVKPLAQMYGGLFITDVPAETKWAYANHAYAILGQLVEDISGMPFPEYMIEHVFEPLGMYKTDYLFSERVRGQFAQGYLFKKGVFEPVTLKLRLLLGAGSIFSSVNEMVKYMEALMNGGANAHGRVLQAETLRMMMTPQLDTDTRVFSMGLGFWLHDFGGHQIAGHGGSHPGFISDMKIAPEEKLGVVVFTNTNAMAPNFIGTEIMYRLLGVPNPDTDFPPRGIASRPYDWSRFCGFYGPKPGFLTNARLWLTFGGEVEVYVDRQNRLAVRTLFGPVSKGLPVYRADDEDPLLYRGQFKGGLMDGYPVSVLFKENHEGAVDRIHIHQNELYKRPYRRSLRFKAGIAIKIIGNLMGFVVLQLLLRKRKKRR